MFVRLRIVMTTAVLACVPGPALACSIVGPDAFRGPGETLLMAVPLADSAYVGRVGRLDRVRLGAWLRPQDFSRRQGAWRHVYAQRVRLERAAWAGAPALARRIASRDAEAVVVRWGLGADCGPVAWNGPTLWLKPGERTVLSAHLRPEHAWIGGKPTFDAYVSEPYPAGRPWDYYAREERVPRPWMSADEFWSMAQAFPPQRRDLTIDIRPLEEWARRNPALARRFPAPLYLRTARERHALDRP